MLNIIMVLLLRVRLEFDVLLLLHSNVLLLKKIIK